MSDDILYEDPNPTKACKLDTVVYGKGYCGGCHKLTEVVKLSSGWVRCEDCVTDFSDHVREKVIDYFECKSLLMEDSDAEEWLDSDDEGVNCDNGYCGMCNDLTEVIELMSGRVRCNSCLKETIRCTGCGARIINEACALGWLS